MKPYIRPPDCYSPNTIFLHTPFGGLSLRNLKRISTVLPLHFLFLQVSARQIKLSDGAVTCLREDFYFIANTYALSTRDQLPSSLETGLPIRGQ